MGRKNSEKKNRGKAITETAAGVIYHAGEALNMIELRARGGGIKGEGGSLSEEIAKASQTGPFAACVERLKKRRGRDMKKG